MVRQFNILLYIISNLNIVSFKGVMISSLGSTDKQFERYLYVITIYFCSLPNNLLLIIINLYLSYRVGILLCPISLKCNSKKGLVLKYKCTERFPIPMNFRSYKDEIEDKKSSASEVRTHASEETRA